MKRRLLAVLCMVLIVPSFVLLPVNAVVYVLCGDAAPEWAQFTTLWLVNTGLTLVD